MVKQSLGKLLAKVVTLYPAAAVPTLIFMFTVKSFGRPMFVFLLLIMVLLATTELGTDSWVSALMTPVLKSFGANAGNWVLLTSVLGNGAVKSVSDPVAATRRFYKVAAP